MCYPYFEGVSTPANAPTFSAKENEEEYNNSQRQCALERNVRKSKRELAALDSSRSATSDPELKAKLDRKFEQKSVTLKRREEALAEHCRKTGSYPDSSRVRVDGFGKSVSQKAVHSANKTYLNSMKQFGVENPPQTLDIFNKMKYNNSPEYELINNYISSVKKGMLSPLTGYEKYKEYYNRVENEIVGIKTSNGVTITGQSHHFLERVFGTMSDPTHTDSNGNPVKRSGVELEDIIDALKNGKVKVNPKDQTSISFVTNKCSVSINKETGKLIQTNRV